MTGRLYFTIGLARSGKSTFATQWQNTTLLPCQNHRVVINDDKIRLAIHGKRWLGLAEPLVHGIEPVMVRTLLLSGYDVLMDNTHTTADSIKKVFRIDVEAKHFFVDTPTEICLERARATGQEDLLPVIRRMHNNLEDLLDNRPCDSRWEKMDNAVELLRESVRSTIIHANREVS